MPQDATAPPLPWLAVLGTGFAILLGGTIVIVLFTVMILRNKRR